MPRNSKLAAIVCGGATLLFGAFYVLLGFGVVPHATHAGDAPAWVIVCIGAMFGTGGGAVLMTLLVGRFARRALTAMTVAFVLGFAAVASWVALGPGHHDIASPLMMFGPRAGEVGGRVAFGLGALVCAAAASAILIRALRAPTSET